MGLLYSIWYLIAPPSGAHPHLRAASYAVQANALFMIAELTTRTLADTSMGAVSGFTLAWLRALTAGVALLLLSGALRQRWLGLCPPDRRTAGQALLFGAAIAASGYFATIGAQAAPVATALIFSLGPLVTTAYVCLQAVVAGQQPVWSRLNTLQLIGGALGVALYSGFGQTTDPTAFVPGLLALLCWSAFPLMSAGFRARLGDHTGVRAQALVQMVASVLLLSGVVFEMSAGSARLPAGPTAWLLVLVLGAGVSGYANKRATDLFGVRCERRLPDGTLEVDPVGNKWSMLNYLKPLVVGIAAATLAFLPFRVELSPERLLGMALTLMAVGGPAVRDLLLRRSR